MEMLKGTNLVNIVHTIQQAEWRLQKELRDHFPDIKFSESY